MDDKKDDGGAAYPRPVSRLQFDAGNVKMITEKKV